MSIHNTKGDFDLIDSGYPECTDYVTSDVTLDDLGTQTTVNASMEKYGVTPNGQPRYLLTVWNSAKKPIPQTFNLALGTTQIGQPAKRTVKKKSTGKKSGK